MCCSNETENEGSVCPQSFDRFEELPFEFRVHTICGLAVGQEIADLVSDSMLRYHQVTRREMEKLYSWKFSVCPRPLLDGSCTGYLVL